MSDMKYSSQPEEEIRFRSRPRKPFYKKWQFGVIVFLILLFGAIGIYIFTGGEKNGNQEQLTEKETEQTAKETEESSVGEQKNTALDKKTGRESIYAYEDFKGTYVLFESEPYKSPLSGMSDIIVLKENTYQTFNRWDYDMTSTILSTTIEDNILTIDLDNNEDEIWGRHSESGTEQFKLRHDGDRKILYSITDDKSMYSISKEDLQTEYNQLEIDYARIIMTLFGKPSLDQWAVWGAEMGVPVIDVSHNSAGDPTIISGKVAYPENVTHLKSTSPVMGGETITYSTQGDGYIKVYPASLSYPQENQSDENLREIAEQAIDDVYTIYVEPFEPYSVADFIGHVEFVYP